MNNAAKYRELRSEIQTVLLKDWDPIGVGNEPQAQDEYDSYLAGVFSLLCRTKDPTVVARHLIDIEMDRMGIEAIDVSARVPVASRLVGLAIRHELHSGPYPCPACGFVVFSEPPGSYDICPVCRWEDDELQLKHPALRGGANALSLVEAQRAAVTRIPLGLDLSEGWRRDPKWRPLSDAEWTRALGTLSPGGHLPALGAAFNEELYYWHNALNAG